MKMFTKTLMLQAVAFVSIAASANSETLICKGKKYQQENGMTVEKGEAMTPVIHMAYGQGELNGVFFRVSQRRFDKAVIAVTGANVTAEQVLFLGAKIENENGFEGGPNPQALTLNLDDGSQLSVDLCQLK